MADFSRHTIGELKAAYEECKSMPFFEAGQRLKELDREVALSRGSVGFVDLRTLQTAANLARKDYAKRVVKEKKAEEKRAELAKRRIQKAGSK